MKSIFFIILFSALANVQSSFSQSIYVTHVPQNRILVINGSTNLAIAAIPVGPHPYGVAVCPGCTKVLITDVINNTLYVINPVTNTVTNTIPIGNEAYGLAVTPDCTKAYVANSADNTVSIINITTNSVIGTIPVGSSPYWVVVSPNGTRAYVANFNSNTVSVINTITDAVIATIPVGTSPAGLAITPNNNTVLVTNGGNNTVSVIDALTNTLTTNIPVPNQPISITVNSSGTIAYVGSGNNTNISCINLVTNTLTNTLLIAGTGVGESVILHPNDNILYIVGNNSNFLAYNLITNTLTNGPSLNNHGHAYGHFLDNSINNLTTCSPATPLPITLLKFVGVSQKGYSYLTWETENEINMINIEVQKSENNDIFYPIGTVDCANHTERTTYHYIDKEYSSEAYYRLKMIDIDGYSTYSSVIEIKNIFKGNSFIITPNPVHDRINIVSFIEDSPYIEIDITNIIGETVFNEKFNNENFLSILIPLSKKGVYFLTLKTDRGRVGTEKIIIN